MCGRGVVGGHIAQLACQLHAFGLRQCGGKFGLGGFVGLALVEMQGLSRPWVLFRQGQVIAIQSRSRSTRNGWQMRKTRNGYIADALARALRQRGLHGSGFLRGLPLFAADQNHAARNKARHLVGGQHFALSAAKIFGCQGCCQVFAQGRFACSFAAQGFDLRLAQEQQQRIGLDSGRVLCQIVEGVQLVFHRVEPQSAKRAQILRRKKKFPLKDLL